VAGHPRSCQGSVRRRLVVSAAWAGSTPPTACWANLGSGGGVVDRACDGPRSHPVGCLRRSQGPRCNAGAALRLPPSSPGRRRFPLAGAIFRSCQGGPDGACPALARDSNSECAASDRRVGSSQVPRVGATPDSPCAEISPSPTCFWLPGVAIRNGDGLGTTPAAHAVALAKTVV